MSTHKDAKSSNSIDQNIVKEETNYLNSMNEAPAVRLDAEFYQADDIDGATEGVVGSGNLNYLVLQSQQSTDASTLNNPFNVLRGDDIFGSDALGGGPSAGDANARGPGDFSDDDNGMALSGNAGDAFSIGGLGNTGSDIPSMVPGVSAGVFDLRAKGFNTGDISDYDETNIVNIENPPPEPPPPEPPEP